MVALSAQTMMPIQSNASGSVFCRQPAHAAPVLMAHRGAPTKWPENTIASFRAALNAGAAVIEMDVRTSKDNVLVVHHDDAVDRTSNGRGAVADMTWEQLRALQLHGPRGANAADCGIPRLEDVLNAFPNAAMNIDLVAVSHLKVAQVLGWIKAVQLQPGAKLLVLLTSARSDTQQAITRENSGATVALGMGRDDVFEVLKAAWLRRGPIERLRGRACQMPAHINLFGVNLPLLKGPLRAYLDSMECALHVWWDRDGMVDCPAKLEKCAQWGVDGVFTNEIEAMAGLGPHEA